MNPLVPFVLSLAPEMAAALFGPGADAVGDRVTQVVRQITGASEPEAAQQAIARDPQAASRLRVELARLAVEAAQSARRWELNALASGASKATSAAATGGGLSASWAAPAVSCIVLVIFGVAVWVALRFPPPAGSETVVTMLLGTLAAMATAVVSYWVGSSAGSALKTELLFGGRVPPATPDTTQASPRP